MRTSVNATLAVNLVGSGETPDNRFVDTGVKALKSGHVITFGDLNSNRFDFIAVEVFKQPFLNGFESNAPFTSKLKHVCW